MKNLPKAKNANRHWTQTEDEILLDIMHECLLKGQKVMDGCRSAARRLGRTPNGCRQEYGRLVKASEESNDASVSDELDMFSEPCASMDASDKGDNEMERFSISQAARLLGQPKFEVRKAIKEGRLNASLQQGKYGPQYFITQGDLEWYRGQPRVSQPPIVSETPQSEERSFPIYEHFRGGKYELITLATHSECKDAYAVYMDLENERFWIRPADMFFGVVQDEQGDWIQRFRQIKPGTLV